jgi:hypothetical protein
MESLVLLILYELHSHRETLYGQPQSELRNWLHTKAPLMQLLSIMIFVSKKRHAYSRRVSYKSIARYIGIVFLEIGAAMLVLYSQARKNAALSAECSLEKGIRSQLPSKQRSLAALHASSGMASTAEAG